MPEDEEDVDEESGDGRIVDFDYSEGEEEEDYFEGEEEVDYFDEFGHLFEEDEEGFDESTWDTVLLGESEDELVLDEEDDEIERLSEIVNKPNDSDDGGKEEEDDRGEESGGLNEGDEGEEESDVEVGCMNLFWYDPDVELTDLQLRTVVRNGRARLLRKHLEEGRVALQRVEFCQCAAFYESSSSMYGTVKSYCRTLASTTTTALR